MTDIVERLRDDSRGWLHPGVAAEAADEIERLRAQGDVLFASIKSNADEIEQLRRQGFADRAALMVQLQEIERLRRLCQDLADVQRQNEETYGRAADEIERLHAKLAEYKNVPVRLRAALKGKPYGAE